MKRKRIVGFILDIVLYIVGALIYSVAVLLFLSANEISPGGLTGIATVLNYLLGLPVGTVVFILNIPLIIIGFIKFGGVFIIKTAIATSIMSVILDISEKFLPAIKVDMILASVFGGLLMGIGISIVMLRGATTGGVDIVAKLINRRYPHLTVGRIMLMTDAIVVIISSLVYRNIESALYSVIALYTSSKIMDIMLYGADKGKIIYIITDNAENMAKEIMLLVKRGITMINVIGAYTGAERKMLMCTVRRNEVSEIYRVVRANDENAFIVVGEAGEIFGQGFKSIK